MTSEDDKNILYGTDISSEYTKYSSIGDQLLSDLKLGGDKVAFINGTTNTSWTYRDVLNQSCAVAKSLHGFGVRQNDVIAIVSENKHELISISLGTFMLNAILTPINPSYNERELRHALELSKPKIVFVAYNHVKKVSNVCKGMKNVEKMILTEGRHLSDFITCLKDFLRDFKSKLNLEDYVKQKVNLFDQTALIMYSSGTTGLPKGVITTQANLMSCAVSYQTRTEKIREGVDGDIIRTVNIGPWFHVIGFVAMYMFASSHENILIFLTRFDEKIYYRSIQTYKANFLIVVPPIMVMLAKSKLFDQFDLSSVKDISSGAAPLTRETEEQVKKRFKQKISIRQGFGMSETTFGVIATIDKFKPGSVGEPLPGVSVKIIDENGRPLGPHQPGEICIKSDRVMKGYVGNSSETSFTIDKDGWLHTGDVAYYDEDKQFFIVDRLKELIKYKAFQVAPAELEGIILTHPKVKDCGVIGIPDELAGELPFAFVVKQPGTSSLTEQEIVDFVAKNVSKTKWLRGGVKFIDEIPKNPSGKLLRKDMRLMYKNMRAKL